MQLSVPIKGEQLENRIARFERLPGTSTAFVDSRLPGGQKRNFKLVAAGKGIFENPDMRPAISIPHNINMSWVLIPPGGGSNLHDHPGSGAELFIPVDGPLMDLSLFPGKQRKWSCFGLLHLEGQPGGRSAGSISWAGVANTFFWIDFESAITAVVFAQSLPFLDPAILPIVDLYERSLYTSLPARVSPRSTIDLYQKDDTETVRAEVSKPLFGLRGPFDTSGRTDAGDCHAFRNSQ
jgi:hypothetical protein